MGHRPGDSLKAGIPPCPPHLSPAMGNCGGVANVHSDCEKRVTIAKTLKKVELNQRVATEIQNELTASQRLKGLPSVCILTGVSDEGESVKLTYSSPSTRQSFHAQQQLAPQAPQEISLLEYIKRQGKIEEGEAKLLFGQLASAVVSCHERLVIHRDLKLPSILVDPVTLVVRVSDFSHSSALSHPGDLMGDRRGSPAYVSPEILVNKTYSGQAADCWSLGVILYSMLCGVFPFGGSTPAELFDRIMRAEPVIPGHLSPQACSLLRGLLKPTPSTRLLAQDALSHPWLTATSDEDQMVPEME